MDLFETSHLSRQALRQELKAWDGKDRVTAAVLLSRIAAAYYGVKSFADLPTPFRCVAVDVRTAKPVVIADGSLARAMRATMAMPLTFPPVIVGDRILVDGGTLNNIPADVAREIAECARLIKGYGDTLKRGNENYRTIEMREGAVVYDSAADEKPDELS